MTLRGTFAAAFAAMLLGLLLPSASLAAQKSLSKNDSLSTTIRASDCVSNATHCHCAMKDARPGSVCLKPSTGGRCTRGGCAAGYKCDCDTTLVCEKSAVTAYKTTDKSSAAVVTCTSTEAIVPKKVVVHTTDFHVVAFQEMQLFVNNDQIGFVQSNDYRVFTSELRSGDVVAIQARRLSKSEYGVKVRFMDLQLETRFIDENWYSTSSYDAAWLDKTFDPAASGWGRPSIATTVSIPSFDRDVPWMWHEASEIMYARYVIP